MTEMLQYKPLQRSKELDIISYCDAISELLTVSYCRSSNILLSECQMPTQSMETQVKHRFMFTTILFTSFLISTNPLRLVIFSY